MWGLRFRGSGFTVWGLGVRVGVRVEGKSLWITVRSVVRIDRRSSS